MRYTLTINGERRDVDVPPSLSLLSVLRDELDLTGSHTRRLRAAGPGLRVSRRPGDP